MNTPFSCAHCFVFYLCLPKVKERDKERERERPLVRMMIYSSVAVLFLSSVLLVSASVDWSAWSTLLEPSAMQCTVCIVEEAVLLGGRNDDGVSNKVMAIDTMNPLVIKSLSPKLPITSTGQFCARSTNQLFITAQGSSLPPQDFNVYYATFDNTVDGYSESTQWVSIGPGLTNRSNTGFGASDGEIRVIKFGGQVIGEYVSMIEGYNITSGRWSQMGLFPRSAEFPSSCNCQTSGHRVTMILVCRLCDFQSDQVGQVHILNYNLETNSFVPGATLLHDFDSFFLSMRSVFLSHYVIMHVSVSNETDPRLWYFDVFQNQLSFVETSSFPEQRSHGSSFPIAFQLFYAGGVYPNGSLSNEVDAVDALPTVNMVPDHGNYSYEIGENVTISLSQCGPGMLIRLGTTTSCNTPIPGVADATCSLTAGNQGVAVLEGSSQSYSSASICLSMGICAPPSVRRIECTNVPAPLNFENCLYASCCWDEENQFCFEYSQGPAENNHFFLANIQPITIVEPATSNQSAFVRFITSAVGIVTVVTVSLLLIVGCGALAWRLLRRSADDEEEEEGSSHPLDQHGKYKVLGKLGQGGFGTVYLVSRKSDGERYAMKYIVCKDEEERDYAIKEFELLYSSQGHPNMIHLIEMFMNWTTDDESLPTVNYGDGEDDPNRARLQKRSGISSGGSGGSGSKGSKKSKDTSSMPLLKMAPKYVCIVTDYFPEGDLAHYILKVYAMGSTVPESMVLDVMLKQCCSLLSHLHTLKPPIVHRDLKPENILLRSNASEVVVTDFGLAQQLEKSYLTTRAGSLHYVAPECWKRHYTAAVDVWALGCIAYGMCTGRVTAETARVMFSDARDRNFDRTIRNDLRGYSDKLRNIVMGMLQPLAAKRLTTEQVLRALQTPDGLLKEQEIA